MARIGLLSISDGRRYVHHDTTGSSAMPRTACPPPCRPPAHTWTGCPPGDLQHPGHQAGRGVAATRADLTIFHYAVWAFPHFTMLAADATRSPLLLVSNIDPVQPGMVGMLAAGGALDQIARSHDRMWGEPDPAMIGQVSMLAEAARTVAALRGATFGRIAAARWG